MRRLLIRLVLLVPVCGFALVPRAGYGQSKKPPSAADRGWGSVWLEPANEQQRKQQELVRKIKAAHDAHDSRGELMFCDQLLAAMPNSPAPYVVRASTYGELNDFNRALADLDTAQAIAQKEKLPRANAGVLTVRARVHERQKDYAAAVSDLQMALKYNAQDEEANNNLAWLRATAPDAAFRNGLEAVRLARKAVELGGEHSHLSLDTLAAAYAESNDYPRAIENERRAMTAAAKEIKEASAAQKFQKQSGERLRLFEQHQPFHSDLP